MRAPSFDIKHLKALCASAATLFLSSAVPSSQMNAQPPLPVKSVLMISPSDRNIHDLRTRIREAHNWQALAHAFHRAGAHVIYYKGFDVPGGAREVYTRDKAIIIGRYAYMSDPEIVGQLFQNEQPVKGSYFPPRKHRDDYLVEMDFVRKALLAQNIIPITVKGAFIEGGNVITHSSHTIIFGLEVTRDRTDADLLLAAINRTQPTQWKMVIAPLVKVGDRRKKRLAYYHLDTFLGREMAGGHTLFYKAATTPEAVAQITNVFGAGNVIALNDQEAAAYAANYSPIGRSVVMPIESVRLRGELESRGYKIISPADYGLETFIDNGFGGPSCKAVDFFPQV